MTRNARTTQWATVSAALLSLILPSCGAGGLDPIGIADPSLAAITGSVEFGSQGATASGARFEQDDNEPNDNVFQLEDLGELSGVRALRGTVGNKADELGDPADLFRFGVRHAGSVRITSASTRSARVLVYRIEGGRGRPQPIGRQVSGQDLEVAVNAGDHLIVGIESRVFTQWNLTLETSTSFVKSKELGAEACAANADTLTPASLDTTPGEVVVRFDRDAEAGLFQVGQCGFEVVKAHAGYALLRATNGEATRANRDGMESLGDMLFHLRRSVNGLASAEPNFVYRASVEPNDTLYTNGGGAWHHKMVNMASAWDITKGAQVIVAVVDSGIVGAHEDLQANLLSEGYDFVDSDPDPSDPLRAGANYHGSHVAGIIGATTDNNLGVAGVGWNTKILPIRVLGLQGTGTIYNIAQAVLYAAGLPNSSGRVPSTKARIINLSLGGGGSNAVLDDAIQKATAAGCIVLAATGNEFQNGNPTSYPAAYQNVIGVGSVGPTKRRAYYSNTGSYVDIVAPGGDTSMRKEDGVLSTIGSQSNPSAYEFYQGTSMATPVASGIVALLVSLNPTLTTSEVLEIFKATSEDLGTPGKDEEYGLGLIDAAKALQKSDTPLRTSKATVRFDNTQSEQTVKITAKNGSMPLTLASNGNVAWLSVSLSTNSTPADLKLTLNRANLPAGVQRAEVKVASGQDTVTIQVTVGEASTTQPRAATVQLIDWTGAVRYETRADGQGRFLMSELMPDDYVLRVGYDANQNGSFEDTGDWRAADMNVTLGDGEMLEVNGIRLVHKTR